VEPDRGPGAEPEGTGEIALALSANELTAADIEKPMSQVTAFFDRYRVGTNRLETQHALVERAGLRMPWNLGESYRRSTIILLEGNATHSMRILRCDIRPLTRGAPGSPAERALPGRRNC
jgi:hypothetical protein